MHVHVDQTGADDETGCVDLVNRGLRIADCGFVRDAPVDNEKIDNFIPLIRRVDYAAVVNDRGAHVAIPPQR